MTIVVCLENSTAAMQFERAANANNIPGRLIPAPRDLQVSCGLAWASPIGYEAAVLVLAETIPHGVIARRPWEL